MGESHNIDWDLLDWLDAVIEDGTLDRAADATFIAAIEAVANDNATEEQANLFNENINALTNIVEAEQRANYMAYLLSKDD